MLENDLRKLESLADSFGGLAFYRLEGAEDASAVPHGAFVEKRIGNEPLLLFREREQPESLHAYSGKCPHCGQLLQTLPHRRSFRCFACETEIAFERRERLLGFPLRRADGGVYVGLPRKGAGRDA